jgi:hypothetical protein
MAPQKRIFSQWFALLPVFRPINQANQPQFTTQIFEI